MSFPSWKTRSVINPTDLDPIYGADQVRNGGEFRENTKGYGADQVRNGGDFRENDREHREYKENTKNTESTKTIENTELLDQVKIVLKRIQIL